MSKRDFTIISGAPNLNSNSLAIAKYINSTMIEFGNDSVLYDLKKEKYEICSGCGSCFKSGKCYIDANDSFSELRNDLIDSKCVIFVTPVFSDNVTVFIKNVIDRIICGSHYMLFAKKYCVILSISDRGSISVTNYLRTIATCLGMRVLICRSLITNDKDNIAKINKVSESLSKIIVDESISYSSIELENQFQIIKKSMLNQNDESYFETYVWKNYLHKFNTFNEMVNSKEYGTIRECIKNGL